MLVVLGVFFPFAMAAVIPLLYRVVPDRRIGWFVAAVPLVLFAGLVSILPRIASGKTANVTVPWIPAAGIDLSFHIDGLSMIFGLLITGVGALVVLYSIYYLSQRESLGHFYAYILLFMGAMLGVVFSDNLMVLYAFWELTSISSFLLIAFWYHRKGSRYGARKSMLITVFGGIGMLAGFLMLYSMTGTFSIRETIALAPALKSEPLYLAAMILVMLGAFTKSAQFPFHIWLPDAMEAPTPVSAYLHSATMVKAGIYLIARFTPVFGGEAAWFWTVSLVGIITLLWGSFNAVKQNDLKALLAYSTISQLGLIMSLLGFGSAALSAGAGSDRVLFAQAGFAALFYMVNHSTFKGLLFMIVGIVDHELGTRDIRRLGGLMALMPVSFTLAVIGSFSMAGLPPFNGFLGKEMFFEAAVAISSGNPFAEGGASALFPVIGWVASVFTFIYCMIIVYRTFLGPRQPEKVDRLPHEAPKGMLVSPIILALFVVGIFFFPNLAGAYVIGPAMPAVFPTLSGEPGLVPHIRAWHGINTPLLMTLGVITAGIILFITLRHWRRIYRLPPFRWNLDAVYRGLIGGTEAGSTLITKRYMTGNLRDYFVYIYVFFLAAAGGSLFLTGAFKPDFHMEKIAAYEVAYVLIMSFAALAMPFVKSRITATLLNGVLGYSIAIFFIYFRAPDLALTQTVIETVTTVLFLLCFRFLPDWKPERAPARTKIVNGLIAVGAGVLVTGFALTVKGYDVFNSISGYFEDAYTLAGGNNIVNAILGDFRAFDTMLEVVVLFIAGIGVYTLIVLKAKKGGGDIEGK
ncbi:Na+/H+ antiporter subunit A [Bhargavaea ullalensis]|uniref:Multicomponent Na+:H+ antiporter subunit A n=1 Tax=Bhargavaea ullalensis TaxID=1265685 RepID=A0ABV2GCQ4_9BACL